MFISQVECDLPEYEMIFYRNTMREPEPFVPETKVSDLLDPAILSRTGSALCGGIFSVLRTGQLLVPILLLTLLDSAFA